MTDTPTAGDDAGTWAKLRRRKVVQWGLAYAAGAWGFMQGLAYVSTLLHWPEELQKLAGLLLLIGLPVVLVIAWYHGDRGEQRVRGVELAIISVLFILGGGLFWRYERASHAPAPAAISGAAVSAPASAATSSDARPSIAVLPFENRSAKQDDVFFVDGIHDDILTQLAKVSAMKVISRTSVERFRDTKLPMNQIAQQLGVTKILEGGVQRAGDRVRITVQLIDTATDTHLWAESYDRELTAANIFAIQSEVATAIAGALKATLTAAEQGRVSAIPTQNLHAWEAYQLGKQRMANRESTNLAEARTLFQKAIDLDPGFSLAYVGMSVALLLQVEYSGAPQEAQLAIAEKALAKALALDPDLSEAWATSAAIAEKRGQYDRAEAMYRRAIALNPNDATANQWFSGLLGEELGRIEESVVYAQRAAELDPLSAVINFSLAVELDSAGRFDEAAARCRKVIQLDPGFAPAYVELGMLTAYAQNRLADAVPLLAKAGELYPGNAGIPGFLSMTQLDLGDDARALAMIVRAGNRWPADARVNSVAASVNGIRGDRQSAGRYARAALAINPRDRDALAILGNADLDKGEFGTARDRYAKAYPELLAATQPKLDRANYEAGVDLVPVLQKAGDAIQAKSILDRSEEVIRRLPRLGWRGTGITDARIHALRGDKASALDALRDAAKAGWCGPYWRYYRDFDPALASIRNEPEFKAVFAGIDRNLVRQRAELAARSKDAPLDSGGR